MLPPFPPPSSGSVSPSLGPLEPPQELPIAFHGEGFRVVHQLGLERGRALARRRRFVECLPVGSLLRFVLLFFLGFWGALLLFFLFFYQVFFAGWRSQRLFFLNLVGVILFLGTNKAPRARKMLCLIEVEHLMLSEQKNR